MDKKIDTIIFHDKYYNGMNMAPNKSYVPIYGKISCGYPKFLDDDLEGYLEIPYSMIGPGEFFVLRADGNSMVDAGINEGDLVLIKKQDYAEERQIVVASYDGEVTLKRIFFDTKNQKYRLHPENTGYDDIIVDNLEVLGVAVKIVKDII